MATVGRVGDGEGPRDDRGDVFPALVPYLIAGAMLGGVAGRLIAGLLGRTGDAPAMATFGASVGTIMGLFVGLGQGVWRPGLPTAAPAPRLEPVHRSPDSPQLWDPWLDSGRDAEWSAAPDRPEPDLIAESPAVVQWSQTVTAVRAPVRPRVVSRETGEAIVLEDEIGAMVQADRCGLIVIGGGPGSGKTTALRHLAAILPPWTRDRIRLIDESGDPVVAFAGTVGRLVITAAERNPSQARVTNPELAPGNEIMASPTARCSWYHLAPWDKDDLIEYLLATHRDRCASVMVRLKASDDLDFLSGIPELWTIVLDRMAADESIGDVRTAIRHEVTERLNDPVLEGRLSTICLSSFRLRTNGDVTCPLTKLAGEGSLGEELLPLVRHAPMRLLLAADRLAAIIGSGRVIGDLAPRLPRKLVGETARRIAGDVPAIQHLNEWLSQERCRTVHPLAASLLHATTPGWRPDPDRLPRLEGAYLDQVAWSGLNLAGVNLRDAELRGADLSAANLEEALSDRAQMSRVDLHGALLYLWRADEADLGGADLRWVTANHARFPGANLAGASLIEANLRYADLRQANIEGADFTRANLEDASLAGLKLRSARFDGARFGGANLTGCDLEEMKLPDADFHDAILIGALLTSSEMPYANFLGADLRNAGLAEVEWPGACLRDADLRGATFHLGTSRNGLVGSPIACEGSRTGFYTDDDHDRDIKPAEEIRKANLRGADLRGARIDDVNFYLVNLRDALYTEDQAEHFHQCRAILDDRIR